MSNHLVEANSLYLSKHAYNPIDWWYWCDRALELAREEDKPIFVSIGYSSCHWCTVMESEAFSDIAIANYLNENFISIKIDREERPDLDSIYMQALQMMTGQGGWPLNIFLTPQDLIPFYGGTYFPIEPRYNRPGFLDILRSINNFYYEEKDKLNNFTTEILNHLELSANLGKESLDSLTVDLLREGMVNNGLVIDRNNSDRPCFPMIPYGNVALQASKLSNELPYNFTEIAEKRGKDLVLGGIFDTVGGGFHRYTVDDSWTVPHFEKMLYDNGQIIEYLANLEGGKYLSSTIKRAVFETINWLKREMRSSSGYFYAAQDADSFATVDEKEPEEGLFYIWSYQELESILSIAELEEFKKEFTVTKEGNFEGNNVLQKYSDRDLSESTIKILDRLFKFRYGNKKEEIEIFEPAKNNEEVKDKKWLGRIPPVTDTKAIVAWNSLIISGLARAYIVYGDKAHWDLAVDAIDFILDNQWFEEKLYRLNYQGKVSILAQSEDYAFLIKALLDLHNARPTENKWLETAIKIQSEFDNLFWNKELGGYNNSSVGKNLLVRERSYIDSAIPSPNGIAIANLVRLSLLTENLEYRDKAERGLQAFATIMKQSPQACPSLFIALNWFINGKVVKTTEQYLSNLLVNYFPTIVYQIVAELPENAIALVCQGLSCLEPAINEEALLAQLTMSNK